MPALTLPLFGSHHSFVDEKLSHKKPSRSSLEQGRHSKPAVKALTSQPSHISISIESPPLVSYGHPRDSTGAILSGLISIHVEEPMQTFQSFDLVLSTEIVSKRPVTPGCHNCSTTTTELKRWSMIFEPMALAKGVHTWPFSYLFPGTLPASSETILAKISYSLDALARTATGDEIKFRRSLSLFRSILPGPDRHSIRIFPPTNLSATVTLPSVTHLGGDFPVEIRLDGVVSNEETAHRTRWRLRKTSWRIDETAKVASTPCQKHAKKLANVNDGKGPVLETVRTVGCGEVRNGWKSDFDTADGKVELEMMVGIPANADAACDVEMDGNILVNHVLVVEMIVAEEYIPRKSKNPARVSPATPTGAARVLRMQFNLCVTTRSGLGISWDEEQPPMYDDVPTAPPNYDGPPSYPSSTPTFPEISAVNLSPSSSLYELNSLSSSEYEMS